MRCSSVRVSYGGGEPGFGYIFADGLGGGEVQADGPALVAFLVQPDGRLVAVLVEVRDFQPAAGAQADAGPQKSFQDGAVAVVDDRFAIGQPDQLPCPRGGERTGFLQRVGGLAGDELGMRGIGDSDGQADLGRGQVFVKR